MIRVKRNSDLLDRWNVLFVLLISSLTFNFSIASTILSMDVDQLAVQSELIFEGEVLQHVAQQDFNTGIINTYVTFSVLDIIKGDYDADALELKFAGGTINGETIEISGLILPKVGEQGIYFVESINRSLVNPLLGWSQGHFLILEEDGERLVNTVSNAPVTNVIPVADIPETIKRPQSLIESDSDSAVGIVSEVSAFGIERALSVDEFKVRILSLIDQ